MKFYMEAKATGSMEFGKAAYLTFLSQRKLYRNIKNQ